MSLTDASSRKKTWRARLAGNGGLIGGAVAIYAGLTSWILMEAGAVPRPRIDLTPLAEAGLAVQIHVAAALVTLLVGIVLMCARKGFRLHRTLGWAWVASMTITAASSFFITAIFQTHYSPIHALSAWTIIVLPMGIAAIRRRDVAKHRREMTGAFVGGMMIAGLFSMLPGRLMWSVFFTV